MKLLAMPTAMRATRLSSAPVIDAWKRSDAMTTERDWRRAYAEASGDHRSYVERYGKSQQPVVSPIRETR